MAGYVREDGRAAYTDFYESLLSAKQAVGLIEPYTKDPDPDLTPEEETLWEHIQERLNLDNRELDRIFDEFSDIGIETPEQFDDAYRGTFDSWNGEAEFAEQLCDDCGFIDQDNPLMGYVNWQNVWDSWLTYSHYVIGGIHFFSTEF
jgi:hypothetical protein